MSDTTDTEEPKPKKKGRPFKDPDAPKAPYHVSRVELAKRSARRKITDRKRKVAKEKAKVERSRKKLKVDKERLAKLDLVTKGKAALVESDLEHVSTAIKDAFEDENVVFKPNPGPQTDFLSAPESDVLYGGAAGGGKSFALLADPLRHIHNPNHRVLILRKTLDELRELIDKSKQLYPKAFPGAFYRETKHTWNFPSGATLEFSYLDRDTDVTKYQGQAYTYIAIDEITHYSTPYVWDYLRSRLRSVDPSIPTYLRCTANPGGVGGWWVKKMYIDPAAPNTSFWAVDPETGKTITHGKTGKPLFSRKFIPARLTDNPYLMQDSNYEAMLYSLPEVERKRLLEGDWDVAEGAAFTEFNRDIHVCDPFPVPRSWTRIRAADYGYASPSCVLWGAVDYDGNIWIYRELYSKGYTAERLAYMIQEMDEGDRVTDHILDSSCWNKTGTLGPSIAEVMMDVGLSWRRADRDRIAGKQEVHRRLQNKVGNGVRFFNTCTNIIRTLPILPLSKTNSEDVDTKADDHAYDALRYMFMSRPQAAVDQLHEFRMEQARAIPQALDPDFGY